MKTLTFILTFILITWSCLSQIEMTKGDFYEAEDLIKEDSTLISNLIHTFNIDTCGLEIVYFFKDFDLNCMLHDEFSHDVYTLSLMHKTGYIKISHIKIIAKNPQPNEYIMIFCFDEPGDYKTINLKIF